MTLHCSEHPPQPTCTAARGKHTTLRLHRLHAASQQPTTQKGQQLRGHLEPHTKVLTTHRHKNTPPPLPHTPGQSVVHRIRNLVRLSSLIRCGPGLHACGCRLRACPSLRAARCGLGEGQRLGGAGHPFALALKAGRLEQGPHVTGDVVAEVGLVEAAGKGQGWHRGGRGWSDWSVRARVRVGICNRRSSMSVQADHLPPAARARVPLPLPPALTRQTRPGPRPTGAGPPAARCR